MDTYSAPWASASFTNVGKKRKRNEDAIGIYSAQQLWLVADGMGGHLAGDFASELVVSTLAEYARQSLRGVSIKELDRLFAICNTELVKKARREQLGVCGTTVATLTFHGNSAVCSWSGDSRIYRLRDGKLLQLTRDHSLDSLCEDRDMNKADTGRLTGGQQLYAAIGGAETLWIDHCCYSLHPDDVFLLCSDGLYKEISEKKLARLLTASSLDEAVNAIGCCYLQSSARDNVAVVCVGKDSRVITDMGGLPAAIITASCC